STRSSRREPENTGVPRQIAAERAEFPAPHPAWGQETENPSKALRRGASIDSSATTATENTMTREGFFSDLWAAFVQIAPQAAALAARFEALGETVVNDHVAFRTFDRGPLRIAALEPL